MGISVRLERREKRSVIATRAGKKNNCVEKWEWDGISSMKVTRLTRKSCLLGSRRTSVLIHSVSISWRDGLVQKTSAGDFLRQGNARSSTEEKGMQKPGRAMKNKTAKA